MQNYLLFERGNSNLILVCHLVNLGNFFKRYREDLYFCFSKSVISMTKSGNQIYIVKHPKHKFLSK